MSGNTWRRFWGTTYPKVPLQNGVGRYVQQLQRITFKFCKSHGGSQEMRDFIEKDLIEFAHKNPGVVVYLKPRRHRIPYIKAEYLNGGEENIKLAFMTRDEIKRWVEYLRGGSGYPTEKLLNYQYTDNASIQGPWTPWMHRDPQLNITTYPDEELSAPVVMEKSATEKLVEIFEKQQLANKDEKQQVSSNTEAT